MDSGGLRDACIRWVQILHAKGQLLGKGNVWECPTRPCRELCKNGWTDRFVVWFVDSVGREESTSSVVVARWRQCALTGGHIDATWRMRYRPSVAAMRPYVKLLWPFVCVLCYQPVGQIKFMYFTLHISSYELQYSTKIVVCTAHFGGTLPVRYARRCRPGLYWTTSRRHLRTDTDRQSHPRPCIPSID